MLHILVVIVSGSYSISKQGSKVKVRVTGRELRSYILYYFSILDSFQKELLL